MRGKLYEYWARSETGKMMTVKDFDLKVYWPRLKDVCKKYRLEYNPNEVVPQSLDLTDSVFKAAKELLLDVGVFCLNTERVIEFKDYEIDEALRQYPRETTIGEGKDAITIKHRDVNEATPPHVLGRVLGAQSPETIDRVFLSYAKERLIDHCHFQGIIASILGVEIKAGTPFEMMAEIKRISSVNYVRKMVDRPGLHDGARACVTLQAELVTYDERWGRRKGDGNNVYILPHLKTSYEDQCRSFATHQFGCNLWGLGQAFVGGLAGSPINAAVVCCAELMAYCLLYEPTYLGIWPADALYFSTTSRTALFATFHCGAAWARNTTTFGVTGAPWGIVVSGPCSEEYFWEHAASAIGDVVCGLNVSGGTGWQSGKLDGATGIGARFAREVGTAAAGIGLKKANELVIRCLEKYEQRLLARNLHETGKRFQDCYDIESIEPTQEYLDIYHGVKNELRECGLAALI